MAPGEYLKFPGIVQSRGFVAVVCWLARKPYCAHNNATKTATMLKGMAARFVIGFISSQEL